ncbi:MAG TPA: alpha/beta fold hydrolase, partial [Vicinamibacterales bacterium]|nr:alpha/beta fold hydrolase [Vicinamibacterales bacterium]
PADITTNQFEAKYSADWQPLELRIDAVMGGKPIRLSTSFGLTTAVNEITQGGNTNSKTDQVSARSLILPNNFFGAYEALAARLATAKEGAELPAYIAPSAEVKITVKSITDEQAKSPSGTLDLRRFEIIIQNPGGPLSASVTIHGSRLARLEIPGAGLSVLRGDLATVSSRPEISRNPTDTDVTIPALGFNLAGTITTPPQVAGRLRHPAIILIAGSGRVDRDARVAGIPIFTQLAGGLAEQGFLVLRYDKRGVGQSGGREESATIQDYADDVLSIVKWLRKRDDVDDQRIALAGHSEGGVVAMIAASKESDDIDGIVLISAPGTRGAELILEQQRHSLDLLKVSEAERKAKTDIQERIQTAVISGVGWEGLPPEYRKAADTPWFRSLLQFDPAPVMKRVKQPVLIVQGDLDKQVFPHHADKLAEMARARDRDVPVEVVHLPGVNHLLVPATTGEVSEYATLTTKKVEPQVATKIAEFLKR